MKPLDEKDKMIEVLHNQIIHLENYYKDCVKKLKVELYEMGDKGIHDSFLTIKKIDSIFREFDSHHKTSGNKLTSSDDEVKSSPEGNHALCANPKCGHEMKWHVDNKYRCRKREKSQYCSCKKFKVKEKKGCIKCIKEYVTEFHCGCPKCEVRK